MKKILFFVACLISANTMLCGNEIRSTGSHPSSLRATTADRSHEAPEGTAGQAEEKKDKWTVKIKNGYFYPQDKTLRNIFDCCGRKGGYWFEGAVAYNVWKELDLELSGSYFGKEGRALRSTGSTTTCTTECTTCCTTGCTTECSTICTKVTLPTLGLGLKYFFGRTCCEDATFSDRLSFFLGAGLRVFFYKEKNGSTFVIPCYKENAVGGMLNAGIEYRIGKHFLIDLFLDYNFRKLKSCCKNSCNTNCCDTSCCTTNCCTGCTAMPITSCCPSYFCDLHLGGLVVGIGLGFRF